LAPKREKSDYKKEELVLLSEIEKTKLALDLAYANFQYVVEPDLIDCCIYELKAVQMRYKFLLAKAKEYDLNRAVVPVDE
jgi:hypothetical protein